MSGSGAPTARYARVSSSGSTPDDWSIRVPGSKSLTNRALLVAGLASGTSVLLNPLRSGDTEAMAAALNTLGATVRDNGEGSWTVSGLGGAPDADAELYSAMSGTTGRFLIPMLAAGHGTFKIDAHEQLRRRPQGPVIDAVILQGAQVDGRAFPLTITATGLSGGEVPVDASVSSQFLSGLLMSAPLARTPTRLRFGAAVSAPYVQLTLDVMRAFGIDPTDADGEILVEPGTYVGTRYQVEPDASTASYFLGSAAVTATTVTLPGLNLQLTHQGDVELVGLLEQMGCTVAAGQGGAITLTGPPQLRGASVNMKNSSDVFMTLACVAPFADSPTTIEGIGNTRVKESDRIAACAENLTRLGITVQEGEDWIRIHPGTPGTAVLPTFEDHRIAMAFSLIGARSPVILEDPGCVAKTCPTFFQLWGETGAQIDFADELSTWS